MRELKFRAWWKDTKRFLDGDEWYMTCSGAKYLHYAVTPYNDDDFTIEQYTGLKDKNGKEIYEGDIIDFFGEKYPVIYRAGCFWAEYSRTQKDYLFLYAIDSEVIGNIHENPELLEEEK